MYYSIKLSIACTVLLSGSLLQAQNFPKSTFLPRAQTAEELEYDNMHPEKAGNFSYEGSYDISAFQNVIVPGEFEENKAVMITWTGAIDKIHAQLVNAIQKEAQVWIVVDTYSDTSIIKNTLSSYGYTASNVKFWSFPYNDFWARDYGPHGFYYNNLNGYGFIDISYYSARPKDDNIPILLAGKLGIPVVKTKMKYEGGNFMTDGFGQSFYSSRVPQANGSVYGWSSAQVNDTMEKVFNMSKAHQLTQLTCDGGTGHIDIYSKLVDEQTIVVAEYPSTVTSTDRKTIEDNVAYLKTLKNTYGKPYTIVRMHTPTTNGGATLKSCQELDGDIRGYVNGLTINKTFIMPTFHSSTSGNAAPDDLAVEKWKKILPGYKIVPIDARTLTPSGGAIHCITMEIPTDNPVRFWHPRVEGQQPGQANYSIVADITNKSGIATANCKWKLTSAGSWNTVPLTLNTGTGKFEGVIPNNNFTNKDTVEYYLEATSNNGKYMTKPITALEGWHYKFYFSGNVGLKEAEKNPHHLFGAYPQPANEFVNLPFYTNGAASVKIIVCDIAGKVLKTAVEHVGAEGTYAIKLNLYDFASGMYFYNMDIDGINYGTRRFNVTK